MATVKRYRNKKAKPGQVIVYYGKVPYEDPDVCVAWGGGGVNKRHANLLLSMLTAKRVELAYTDEFKKKSGGLPYFFGDSYLTLLENAGFDITTLQISISCKKEISSDPA